jgi:hypothetical protein
VPHERSRPGSEHFFPMLVDRGAAQFNITSYSQSVFEETLIPVNLNDDGLQNFICIYLIKLIKGVAVAASIHFFERNMENHRQQPPVIRAWVPCSTEPRGQSLVCEGQLRLTHRIGKFATAAREFSQCEPVALLKSPQILSL